MRFDLGQLHLDALRADAARVVGGGWNARHVFSSADGVIYIIDHAGNLFWFRHDGQVDGSFLWTEGPKLDGVAQSSGTGRNVRNAFAGGDGVIYAIDDAGDLLWYRHDGRADGSFRWTDNNAREVGVGWNVKHVFAGEGGVIYTIDQAGDLNWFRHDGRTDGSFRWADANPRKVGSGWNVKHAFAGRNGVIYAIDAADDLLWYRHEGRDDGSFRWADNHGRKVGVGWNLERVFGA